jgi:DNA-binding SARP family transcriptional activator/tetratricopeptide (TPR) repeat protein
MSAAVESPEMPAFGLLGPFEVTIGGRAVALGGARRQTVLAVLLVNRNEVVSVDRLLDEVWQGDPPARARDTLQAHLAHLRRALAGAAGVAIERRPPGYVLRVPDGQLDASEFERLVDAGRQTLADGRPEPAARQLLQALRLWRGAALHGIDDVPAVALERTRLEQLRRDAVEDWADAQFQRGRPGVVVGPLEQLLGEDPWRERATALLMLALYRSGRQVDALATYERLRTALADELGLVPSPELRALEGDILRQVPDLTIARAAEPAPEPDPEPAPREMREVLPFVGRDAELARLTGALRDAMHGRRAVALVRSEAGGGKTRLVRELSLAARGHNVTVLSGRCDEDPLAPYQPFLEAISSYVDRAGDDAVAALAPTDRAELARALPRLRASDPAPRPDASPREFERLHFFEAVIAFLRSVAPVVLVLDDVHCADAGSLALLRHVLHSPADLPFLVVAAVREGDPGTERAIAAVAEAQRAGTEVVDIRLEGLDEPAVAALTRAALGEAGAGGGPDAAELWRATDGNPFYVRELLRGLVDGGTDAGLELPPTVQHAIAARMAPLPRRTRTALDVAAVIGEEFDLDVLAEILEIPDREALDDVETALRAGIFQETAVIDRFRFGHALFRRYLLDEIGSSKRVRLHHLAGTALEKLRADELSEHLAELAHHFGEAARVVDAALAVAYARRAGERAMDLLAFEEAAQHFNRALSGLGLMADADEGERCELLLRLGDALNRAGDTQEASLMLSTAAAIAIRRDDTGRLVRAAFDYGGHLTEPGPVDTRRVALLEQALEQLGDDDLVARARLLARLALALEYVPGPRASRLSTEAVELARTTGDDAALTVALHAKVSLHSTNATGADRLAAATELLALAERVSDADLAILAHAWRVMGLLEVGDGPGVDLALAELIDAAHDRRQPLYDWGAAGFRAMHALLRGDFAQAEAHSARALELGRRVQSTRALQNHATQTLMLRWFQGRLDEVAPLVEAMAASPSALLAWQVAATWVESQLGQAEAACNRLAYLIEERWAEMSIGPFASSALAMAGEACAGCGGSPVQAAQLYEALLPFAGEAIVVGRASICIGSADRYLGLLAAHLERWEEAERHLEAALIMNERLGAAPIVALAQANLASVLAARGRPTDAARATALADAAAEGAARLGMEWLRARVAPLMSTGAAGARVLERS